MPTTNYMQRSPRHDHGWLKPDPLLTKELGIPNACSRCHEDKGIDWVIAKADEWYGPRLDSRQRARSRAVAAAQGAAPGAVEALLALLRNEDIPAWRATYLSLLTGQLDAAMATTEAQAALTAADPMERSAAVRFFSGSREASRLLSPLLQDPVRLVRLDAAWALAAELPAESAARAELDAYLQLTLDQPAGRLRIGQDLANRGNLAAAEREMARAVDWDPYSPGIRESHAFALAGLGRMNEAGNAFYRAAEMAGPQGVAQALNAGLAFAEGGRWAEAENSFRLAIRLDPGAHRARYNLGLLLAQAERLPEAAAELRAAETAGPEEADYAFALATVLLRTGDREGARQAAERALRINPAHPGARQMLDTQR
jgi:tetratricopeptide (TPR) repeat protein